MNATHYVAPAFGSFPPTAMFTAATRNDRLTSIADVQSSRRTSAQGGPSPFAGDAERQISCPILAVDAISTKAGPSDSAFVAIYTVGTSRIHIPVIATRLRIGIGASGNTRARRSGNSGGSINFSVTFVALPYDLLK